jgi:hypothetical protein
VDESGRNEAKGYFMLKKALFSTKQPNGGNIKQYFNVSLDELSKIFQVFSSLERTFMVFNKIL